MQRIISLYTSYRGSEPAATQPIGGSGSNRRYVRLSAADGTTLIGVIGTSVEENEAFFHIASTLAANGINVPAVVAVSADRLCYLQTDLGRRSLFDALQRGREAGGCYAAAECGLVRSVVSQLPRIQLLGQRGLDYGKCYPQPEMDATNVAFDLNYFKYCFLKPSGIDFNELRLEHDFQAFAHRLLAGSALPQGFVYRDFQARNVMLDADDHPWFIDFQGGRRGPLYYDLASFLWQASARYPSALRHEAVEVYLKSLREVLFEMQASASDGTRLSSAVERELDPDVFRSRLSDFVVFRLMQVLGAYGYRGYFERKRHFLESIPPAIESLRTTLAGCGHLAAFGELHAVLQKLTAAPAEGDAAAPPSAALRVRVFSFSYKRGIPADESGNGGGYVFDCRSSNNPGRYAEYKTLTGLDAPVVRFLEDDGEIVRFLDSVYALADFHVARYIERGFTDLMFAFGCTGGQHRSVYCAQHLAERLHRKFGVSVELCHREQGIMQVLS